MKLEEGYEGKYEEENSRSDNFSDFVQTTFSLLTTKTRQ